MDISVIVPTHNRCHTLQRTVQCLLDQSLDGADYEIIVVDDRCTDGTGRWLANQSQDGIPVRVVNGAGTNVAAARNAGIAEAQGELVCLVDDDILVGPGFLEAHRAAHDRLEPRTAVLGSILPCPHTEDSLPNRYEDARIARALRRIRAADDDLPGHYLCAANASVNIDFLRELGPFNQRLGRYGYEDAELGRRLVTRGGRLHFEPAAAGMHLTRTTVEEILWKRAQAGRSAACLLEIAPDAQVSFPAPQPGDGPLRKTLKQMIAVPPARPRHRPRVLQRLLQSATAGRALTRALRLTMRRRSHAASFALLDLLTYHHYANGFLAAQEELAEGRGSS